MKDKSRKPNFLERKKQESESNSIPLQSLPVGGILSKMVDGRELESLINQNFTGINAKLEIQASIAEIEKIRKRPAVCIISNTISPFGNNMLNDSDELPFEEMIQAVGKGVKEIDVIIETNGGLSTTVAKLVDRLRSRFEHVGIIILNKAMSAGTMLAMSGDEIIMTANSQIGPIDPQFPRQNGAWLPAQAILILIDEVQKRGDANIKQKKPIDWTDQLLINGMDRMEIGNAMSASLKSIQQVEKYLEDYKFKHWNAHSDGRTVTPQEKKDKANEIAALLCKHDKWKDHGHAIDRKAAWTECKLKIVESESIDGLDRAMKRMWALFYYLFNTHAVQKAYVSANYGVIKSAKLTNEKK